ncbi:Cysteine/O-acetylserine efflux protein [Acinetobacter calcoaceticus]|uniref:Cysteine/O-acetylserine efflux protein n=1 Tax=Acinetobacter calcoaceticus TaxID=471 RepID=A0A446ZKI7_ACICA|nr:LysE family translocator [Acinetobacter calcoaceticus]VAX45006.1 Cysteine/O-acetylserine efflux protein [Acinetobacter calcoaceticus]
MEIFLYTLSVMYSPGPVNFMGLNAGLTGQFKKTIYFFMGVGCAMLMLFMIFGYAGAAIIPQKALHYIALLGACYTFYLAFQMLKADIDINNEATEIQTLSFWNGFWIQTLNPKGILVILPVTTIMYPTAHITGIQIFLVSLLISIGAAGAPCLYSWAGAMLGKKIKNKIWFNRLNKTMAMMLIISGIFMLYDFLKGMNLV